MRFVEKCLALVLKTALLNFCINAVEDIQYSFSVFYADYYKTLMHLSGCPVNLGCTVMLRGSHFPDLIKVNM